MKISEYQALAMRTCSIPYEKKFDKLVHGVCGLMSEIYEFQEALKYTGEILETHAIKELGDMCWMIAEICDTIAPDEFERLVSAFHSTKVNINMNDVNFAKVKLCEIIQKKYQGHEVNNLIVAYNMKIILDYILGYCDIFVIKLENVLEININKLKARYPEGFNADQSLHRAKGDI